MAERNLPVKLDNDSLRTLLERYKPHMQRLLPRHIKTERMFQVMLLGIQRTPRLLECTPASLMGSLLQCAQLGLEPDGLTGKAYLVPYFNRNVGRYVCEIIPGYRGLMDLARRSGSVTRFQAFPVYEGDEFEYRYGFDAVLNFKPLAKDRSDDKLVAAFAMAYESGEPKFHVSDRDEIEEARGHSKAKNDGPWKDHFPAMAMKTAVRRFCKFLPASFELSTAVSLDELHETQLPQGVELMVPELIGDDEIKSNAEARARQVRPGGPYPSDVFAAGTAKGWQPVDVEEFVDGLMQKRVQDLERGAECARVIQAIEQDKTAAKT